MNYIHDIYKIKPLDQDNLDQDNLDQDYLFSIIYVEYEKYHDYTDIISTTKADLQKLKRELQKLKRDELVIMYKGIFSLPDSTEVTAIEDVLIDAIINETKVPEIIEKIIYPRVEEIIYPRVEEIIYPRDSGGAKNKKRTTIKSGHTLLRKTKHTNRNKIYRNKIYRNTKRIRQTKRR